MAIISCPVLTFIWMTCWKGDIIIKKLASYVKPAFIKTLALCVWLTEEYRNETVYGCVARIVMSLDLFVHTCSCFTNKPVSPVVSVKESQSPVIYFQSVSCTCTCNIKHALIFYSVALVVTINVFLSSFQTFKQSNGYDKKLQHDH